MKKPILGILLAAGLLLSGATQANAFILTENFSAPFPAWESGWLGTNSNLTNYYGVGEGRGNNPDGLWIGNNPIVFDSEFGATLTSLDIDIANWTTFSFQAYDMNNNLLIDQILEPNFGAYSNPGTYWHLSTTSSNGISRLVFNGQDVLGNTSIDNIVVRGGDVNAIPEPATILLFSTGLVGAGAFLRKRNI